MKKLLGTLPILFVIFAFALPFSASAETTAGVKPDSFFYSFDLLGEKISLFFTRDPYEKAKKNILFADERIAEIEAVKDDTKAKLKAANEYEKNVSRAFDVLDDIESKEQKAGVLVSFANRYEKHWGTLIAVYDSLPDEDKPVFRGTLVTYLDSLEKGAENVQKLIAENETKNTNNNDPSVKTEIESLRQEIAAIKQQKPPSVAELKKSAPQQYESLVTENKSQLVEASKLLSNRNIISKVKPSVVFIETSAGSGSGIVIESNGYILTNAHVVSGVNSATIKFANGQSYSGTIVGRDENIDLALLKASAINLTPATLGNSDFIEQGDPVFTFGYPLGIEGDVAFKDGTLSRRQKIDGATYLEISAQILPGNSGGPLVNQSGEVIGVNTLALGASKIGGVLIGETLKYAIPINIAKDLIAELKNGRNVVIPKLSIKVPAPSPTPNPSQPIIPPSVFTPIPEAKPEPVRTTISNIVAKEESYGVVISWDSNKSTGYGGWRALISKQSDLSGAVELKPTYKSATYSPVSENTTYYYQVFVKDGCTQCLSYDSVEAKSQILSITTKPSLTPAPAISSINASSITKDSATISWVTNIDTYPSLEYGAQGSNYDLFCTVAGACTYSQTAFSYTDTIRKKTHQYKLTGLKSGVAYRYRISAKGLESGRPISISEEHTFETLAGDTIPPTFISINAKIQSDNATPVVWGDKAIISYQTNEPTQSKVEYSTDANLGSPTVAFNNFGTNGYGDQFNAEINGLSRETTYYYQVTAIDQSGNKTVSNILNFVIPPESTN